MRKQVESVEPKEYKIWVSLMNLGSRIGCHQKPDRSFFIKGYQFPVCARCTGVIIGELLTIILLLLRIKVNYILCVTLLALMGLDWFIQYIKVLYSNNIRRLITGICGGIGLTYIYYYMIIAIINIL